MPFIRLKDKAPDSARSFHYEPGTSLVADGVEPKTITITKNGIMVTADIAQVALRHYEDVERVPRAKK
jgi:hypothetical protein